MRITRVAVEEPDGKTTVFEFHVREETVPGRVPTVSNVMANDELEVVIDDGRGRMVINDSQRYMHEMYPRVKLSLEGEIDAKRVAIYPTPIIPRNPDR